MEQCITNLMQTPYTGTVSVTNHMFTCMDWSLAFGNDYDAYFPTDGGVVRAKNYCRNPGGFTKPYCYINHPYIVYGYCNLRICNGKIIITPIYYYSKLSSSGSLFFRSGFQIIAHSKLGFDLTIRKYNPSSK